MLVDIPFRILGKADDVGKVRANAMLSAQADNIAVGSWTVLPFMRRQQCLAIERFRADKHLVAASLGQKCY